MAGVDVVLGSSVNDRFTVRRRLGSGSFGDVFEAFDSKRHVAVALKQLSRLDASALYRFKQEFRLVAGLVHPNLVGVHELFAVDGAWYLTMDLVDGLDFLDFVRPALASKPPANDATRLADDATLLAADATGPPTTPIAIRDRDARGGRSADIPRLRHAVAQVAAGIAALHRAGMLHRDLKPSNVRVTPDGRVVLLDFGLLTEIATSDRSAEGVAVGTPAYMAPEQACGQASQGSDYYALGAMIYEALSGRLPFSGSAFHVLVRKQVDAPPDVRTLASGLPDDLCELAMQLLHPDPSKRPSADAIFARLGAVAIPTVYPDAPLPRERTAQLVGRDAELAVLESALARVTNGESATMLVHGASGIGKTALVRRFLEGAARARAGIFEGRCFEREQVPYKALDSLVDSIARHLSRLSAVEAAELMPRDVATLARLFPVLEQVGAVQRAPRRSAEQADVQELRRRAFGAMRELVARMSDRRPVVFWIDDVQWSDADSAALLVELLRAPAPPLLLIASFRTTDAETSDVVRALRTATGAAGAAASVHEIALGPLDAAASYALAAGAIGTDVGEMDARAAAIARESGGHPFFAQVLARFAENRTQGALGGEISLARLLEARIAELSRVSQAFLEIVAVAGRPVPLAIARQAAEIAPSDEHAIVAELRAQHLLRMRTADRVETFHDRIREAVVARMAFDSARARHRALAVALEAAGDGDAEALTTHFYTAGDIARASGFAERAADRAAEALAFERAAELYGIALEGGGRGPIAVRALQKKLASSLALAGRGRAAAEAYLLASAGADELDARELRRLAAEQLLLSGHIDEGLATLRDVLHAAGMRLPRSPQAALLGVLAGRAMLHVRGVGFRQRDEKEIDPQLLARVDLYWSVTAGLANYDLIRSANFQTRHLELALEAGEPDRIIRALSLEAVYSAHPGPSGHARAERMLALIDRIAAASSTPLASARAAMASGIVAFVRGQWRRSRELCDAAEAAFQDVGNGGAFELTTVRVHALTCLFYLGEVAELCRRLPGLRTDAELRGDLYAMTRMLDASFIVALVGDRPDAARDEIDRIMGRLSLTGFQLPHFLELVGGVHIAIYSGRGGDGWRSLEARWPELERSLMLRAEIFRVVSAHLRGTCALAASADAADKNRLLAAAGRDAARLSREKAAYAKPMEALLRGGIARARGALEPAVTLLADAVAGFEAADMALFAAAARRRVGEIEGGDGGRERIASADAWMRSQGIQAPERMADMLAPVRGR